jgi:hypothetical protein
VTDENPDAPDFYGEYQINGALRVDDLLYRLPAQPTVGESFRRIRGVLHHSFYNFKLEPRQASDYQR